MKYYSPIKKKEILPFATWMTLEDSMPNEISHPEKDKYCVISLTFRIENNQSHRNQTAWWLSKFGWGG